MRELGLGLGLTRYGVGGSTLNPALTAPLIASTAGQLVYPMTFTFDLDPSTLTTDSVRLTLIDDSNGNTAFSKAIVVGTGPLDFSAAAPRLSDIVSGTHTITARIERGATYGPNSNILNHGPDIVAPVLSASTSLATGSATATIGVTTNTAEGALYYITTTSSTPPSTATVKAGATQAITTSGSKTANITGLTASTAYYGWFVHTDVAGNNSAVTGTPVFTTEAAAAFSMTETAAPASQNVNNTANNHTFPTQAFGAASSGRRLLIPVFAFDGGTNTPSSVTAGGVSATMLDSNALLSLWEATVPTGTSGDVAVVMPNNAFLIGIKVIRVVGATGSATVNKNAYTYQGDMNLAVTTPSGGGTFIAAASDATTGTGTWTNATGQSEIDNHVGTHSSAIRTTAGAATVTLAGFGFRNAGMTAVSYSI